MTTFLYPFSHWNQKQFFFLPFWFSTVHTPKLSSEEEIVPHRWSFFALPWSEHGARQGVGSLLWFSWEFFPALESPFCLWARQQALQPPLKNTSENMLRTLFWKGKLCILCGLSFLSITPLFAQTQKIALPPANLFGFFSPNAQLKISKTICGLFNVRKIYSSKVEALC